MKTLSITMLFLNCVQAQATARFEATGFGWTWVTRSPELEAERMMTLNAASFCFPNVATQVTTTELDEVYGYMSHYWEEYIGHRARARFDCKPLEYKINLD